MKKIIRIGTRGSALALAQSGQIRDRLAAAWPEVRFELEVIRTTGDEMQKAGIKPAGDTKAVFTKEIEEALISGRADLAVHGAKDLAVEMPAGLVIGAVPERESSRDVLVLKPGLGKEKEALPEGSVILTGSARRRLQWLEFAPQTRVEPLRGNIDTRLGKLREGSASGIILAEAGLKRLEPDVSGLECVPLDPESEMIPAPGQGALALQCREGDGETLELLRPLNDGLAMRCLEAERVFLREMDCGCHSPLGALAVFAAGLMRMRAVFYPSADGKAERHEAVGAGPDETARRLARAFGR